MSGFLGGRASGRRNLRVSHRSLLVGLLLATQTLVPVLLAQEQILQSVVRIQAVNNKKQKSLRGTGVAVEGGVITAAHVVENCDSVSIFTGDGDESFMFDGEVVFSDDLADIAFIKLQGDVGQQIDLKPAVLNTNFPVQPGTDVYAIGNSLGFTRTISKGIVSASGTKRGERYLFTDALTRQGNSGGPLVNGKGEVIALVLGSLDTAPQGQLPAKDPSPEFTYTIPAADIQRFLESKGIASKGYLGVLGKTVRVSLGLGLNDDGLEIVKVINPCGLQVGDILLTVEDAQIGTQRDLIRAVRGLSPGDRVNACVLRKGLFTNVELRVFTRN